MMALVQQVLAGRLPNVYYEFVSLETLRLLPSYKALCPVDWLLTSGTPSYRYVRQEDPLWSLLHQGVLTTGYLPATLGFFEPQAAKRLGLPKARVSHKHLLEAYERLLLPQYFSPQQEQPASPSGAASSAAEAAAAAELHNSLAVERFNAGKATQPLGSPPLPPIHWCAPGQLETTAAASLAPLSNKAGSGQASMVKNGGIALGQSGDAGNRTIGQHAEQQRDSVAPIAGAGRSKSKSQRRRDRKKRHEQQQQQQQHGMQARNLAGTESQETANGAVEQPRVSRQSKLVGLSEEEKLRLARSLGQQGFNAICCAWGKVQEPASLRALAALLGPSSQLVEVGLCRLDCEDLPQEWGFEPGTLPPLGASPDALVHHTLLGINDSLAAAGQVPLPPQLGTMCDKVAGSYTNGYATSAGGGAGSTGYPSGDSNHGHSIGLLGEQLQELHLAQELPVVEVVEVKNTCPFGVNQHRGQRWNPAEPYMLSDRGPRHDVKPEWVPQLQLHMLCAGTRSALLVSRSATKGLHVFRVARDDVYLQLMLRVLSRFWSEYVQRRRQPPQDMFSSWAEYHRLLAQTAAIARSAELALAAPQSQVSSGGDGRIFLD